MPGALDIRTLAGLPADAAIARIVDAFCPPGILDEDVTRLAVGEALATALGAADTFDPAAINENAVRLATLTFAAELAFLEIVGADGGALATDGNPVVAVQRESDIRSLVREVADVVGTPILAAAGTALAPEAAASLVSRIVTGVYTEMATW